MTYMYYEMQNKLSKTRESPLESIGQVPYTKSTTIFLLLHKLIFLSPKVASISIFLSKFGVQMGEI